MSKKSVEILRSKMTLEERREFVRECEDENGKDWFINCNSKTISELMVYPFYSFWWHRSDNGYGYWLEIYERFTPEELDLVINIKEF